MINVINVIVLNSFIMIIIHLISYANFIIVFLMIIIVVIGIADIF